MGIEQTLMRMKKEKEEIKAELDRAQGRLDQCLHTLKTQFGYTDLKTAKAELDKALEKIAVDKQAHETAVRKLEGQYEWESV